MSAVMYEVGTTHAMLLRCRQLVKDNPAAFNAEFADWLANNPHIWLEFVRQADAVRAKGRKHYSSRTIVEVIRHESVLREAPIGEYKINDHVTPDLARLYILFRPEAYGFFELRGERKPA